MEKELSKKEKLAYAMYDDYCEAVGGKAFNGDPLPKSDEFFNDPTKTKQSLAWIKAAETAIAFITTDTVWGKFEEESKRQKDLIDGMALDILTGKKKPGEK